MPHNDLDLEYQFQDMLAQQNKGKYKTQEEADAARAAESATRKGGSLIRTAPISKGASLRQKVQARRGVR